jgi:tRNA nucleotidyltransferase (CCA-adding enzyme)
MAISLHPNSRGLLLDPTNGAADIERRELRVLHPRSFSEDPLRVYRFLRLALRLDFTPEERTKIYFETALQNRVWERLDAAQQGRELRAILQEENPARILKVLAERKLLGGLDKKLASTRIAYDRFSRSRAAAQTIPGADCLLVNFLCLVERLSSSEKLRMAKKVLGSGKLIKEALNLERDAKKLARVLVSSKAALPHQVYSLLARESQHLLLFLLVYYPQAKIQSRVKNFLTKYLPLRAKLPRAELQALGFKPGVKFDQIIESIFLDQVDGKIKTPQQLTKALRERAGIKEPPAVPEHRARRPRKPKEVAKAKRAGQEAGVPSVNPPESPSSAQTSPRAREKGKAPARPIRQSS